MNFTEPGPDAGERVCDGIGSPLTPRRLRTVARYIAAALALYVVLGGFFRR